MQWGTMPKVRVTLSMRTGNAFEKANEVWLADLTGDLMREGTATRTAAQISQEAARMGGSLTIGVGADDDHDRRRRAQRVRPADGRSGRRRRPQPEVPGIGAAAAEGQHGAQPRRRSSASRSSSRCRNSAPSIYGDHAYGRVFPTEEMVKGFTLDAGPRFYNADLRRRALAALRRRALRCRGGGGRDPQGVRRLARRAREPVAAAAQADVVARRPHRRSSRRAAVHRDPRGADRSIRRIRTTSR